MPRTVSQNFKQQVFNPRTGEAFIILLELDHADLIQPIRVTPDPLTLFDNGSYGVVSNDEQYLALPFEIILPGQDPDSPPVSRIKIDNINREIGLAVRRLNAPPDAVIKIVLSSNPDLEEIVIEGFQLGNIRLDGITVEGELTMARTDLRQFPPNRFTPSLFPAMH